MKMSSKEWIREWIKNRIYQIRQKPLLAILLLTVGIRILYLLLQYPLWWDSHVYISIGKYIFSAGKIGSWESFRPLIHPFILGFFWKLTGNPILVGKILDVIFSAVAVALAYFIGTKIEHKNTAAWGALLLSITPLFIMFTGLILTEPLALVFGLAGVLCYLQNRETNKRIYLCLAGILLSASFLTKFPQGIWFGAIGLVMLWKKQSFLDKAKDLVIYVGGFMLPVLPYLIFNYYQYGNSLEPFITGSWIVTTATWLYGTGIFYYFTHFFIANPLYLLVIGYMYFFLRQKEWQNYRKLVLVLIPLLSVAYFLYVPRKEVRYLVTSLPFLALMVSASAIRIYHFLKQHQKPILRPFAFILISVLLVLIPIPVELHFDRPPSFQREIIEVIQENDITGTILSSDPSFVSFLDYPIVTLDGMEFATAIYNQNRGKYQLLFVNSCDLICAPEDQSCQGQKQQLLTRIAAENKEMFHQEIKNCTYSIYLPEGFPEGD